MCCLFCLNPLLGYLADTYPLLGYRRKSYLILIGIVGTLGYLLAATTSHFNFLLYTVFMLHFLIDSSNAFRVVLMDSLCVTMNNYKKKVFINTRTNESTKSVAIVFISKLLGKILSNSIFGIFYHFVHEKCKVIRFLLLSSCSFFNNHQKL